MPPALAHILAHYGAVILGALVFFMNLGIPVPGHMAYVTSVVLSTQGRMPLPVVIAVSIPAAFLGSWLGFLVGQRGGHALVVSYGPRVGLNAERLAAMERFFARHGGAAIFFMRFVVVVRTFGSVVAGMNEVPTPRFLIYSAAGSVAWAAVYAVAAAFFRESWHAIEDWLGVAGIVGLCLLAAAGLAHVVWRWRRRRRNAAQDK